MGSSRRMIVTCGMPSAKLVALREAAASEYPLTVDGFNVDPACAQSIISLYDRLQDEANKRDFLDRSIFDMIELVTTLKGAGKQ